MDYYIINFKLVKWVRELSCTSDLVWTTSLTNTSGRGTTVIPACSHGEVTFCKIKIRGSDTYSDTAKWFKHFLTSSCVNGGGGVEGLFYLRSQLRELTDRTQPPLCFLPSPLTPQPAHPSLQKQPNRIRLVKVLPVHEWEDECDNTSLLWTVVLQIITKDQDQHA